MANNEQDNKVSVDLLTNRNNNDDENRNVATTSPIMKLIVRSQYWGRILKGKARRDHYGNAKAQNEYRVITCQAVLSNEGQYWGCCPHHGKRVLELNELHFTDHHPHDWDLYMVGSSVTSDNVYHNFFLLPQNQSVIDINRNMRHQGWSYVGTASASMARMDLGGLLHDLLKQNKDYGFRYHHVHIDIMMEHVYDRETPRSRKTANEEARAERCTLPKNSKRRAMAMRMEKNNKNPPMIPHVISNNASWETQTSHSSSATSMCYEHWNDSFHHQQNWPMVEQHFQWYPATMPQMMPSTMVSGGIQQMLQGYPMAANMPPYPYQDPSLPSEWMMMSHPENPGATLPYPDGMMMQHHPECAEAELLYPDGATMQYPGCTEAASPYADGMQDSYH